MRTGDPVRNRCKIRHFVKGRARRKKDGNATLPRVEQRRRGARAGPRSANSRGGHALRAGSSRIIRPGLPGPALPAPAAATAAAAAPSLPAPVRGSARRQKRLLHSVQGDTPLPTTRRSARGDGGTGSTTTARASPATTAAIPAGCSATRPRGEATSGRGTST